MGQRILAADDELGLRMVYQRGLSTKGYEVTTTETGDEALALLRSGQPFDLLITDNRMPGTQGVDIGRIVKNEFPKMPVILVTADVDGKEMANEAGLHYMGKPVSLSELHDAVKKALNGSNGQQNPQPPMAL